MTRISRPPEEPVAQPREAGNGAAMASFLGAGIGALAMGLFVILNEAGLFAAPALYGRAGGVSGRTTFAIVVWIVAWVVLHARWRRRQIEPRPVFVTTLVLTVLGILGTLPPVWGLF